MLVLPAPVGPVMTNSSNGSKSISCWSRKAVNPSIDRLSGRTGDLLEQLVEQLHQRLADVGPVPVAVVLGEQVTGFEALRVAWLAERRPALVVKAHVERARNDLANEIRQPGGRSVAAQHDANPGLRID